MRRAQPATSASESARRRAGASAALGLRALAREVLDDGIWAWEDETLVAIIVPADLVGRLAVGSPNGDHLARVVRVADVVAPNHDLVADLRLHADHLPSLRALAAPRIRHTPRGAVSLGANGLSGARRRRPTDAGSRAPLVCARFARRLGHGDGGK